MSYRIIIPIIVAFFAVLPVEAQCAMCRAVLESEDGGAAAKGINNGILYLMIFPYLLVGGVGYAVYKMRKKAKEEIKL